MRRDRGGDVHPVYTVGHSNRPWPAFLALLLRFEIGQVLDVRAIPRSRVHPWFSSEKLASALKEGGIAYVHARELGGLRRPRPDSPNVAWRNQSFRGFADYMQTPEFWAALEGLLQLAKSIRTALMCSEALPWRCHRRLIADALTARGVQVFHILSSTRVRPHALTPWARVVQGRIVYGP